MNIYYLVGAGNEVMLIPIGGEKVELILVRKNNFSQL